MELIVASPTVLEWQGRCYRCALGRSGVKRRKVEGDGATPAGRFPLRRVFFRPDRVENLTTALPCRPLKRGFGWCDDPRDPAYNTLVPLPYEARAERLWRPDHLYDVIVVVGYNDDPPVPGLGSAIFLHLADDDYGPTQGCVALARADLVTILTECAAETWLVVPEKLEAAT